MIIMLLLTYLTIDRLLLSTFVLSIWRDCHTGGSRTCRVSMNHSWYTSRYCITHCGVSSTCIYQDETIATAIPPYSDPPLEPLPHHILCCLLSLMPKNYSLIHPLVLPGYSHHPNNSPQFPFRLPTPPWNSSDPLPSGWAWYT